MHIILRLDPRCAGGDRLRGDREDQREPDASLTASRAGVVATRMLAGRSTDKVPIAD